MDSNKIKEDIKRFSDRSVLSSLEKTDLVSIVVTLSESLNESVNAIEDLREAVSSYKRIIGRSSKEIQGLN